MKITIKKLIEEGKTRPKTEIGQHFTVDQEVIDDLIRSAQIKKKDRIVEVGAGSGILTERFCQKAGFVYAYEIDKQFKPFLTKLAQKYPNLDVRIENICQAELSYDYNKVVGNIPFHISEVLLWTFRIEPVELMAFVMPLPFAQKLVAKPKDEKFTEISVIFSARFNISIEKIYEKESFYPLPPVKSALVKMSYVNIKNFVSNPPRYIFRYIWDHKTAKLKNALTEALVNFVIDKTKGKKRLTKNQARKFVDSLKIEQERLGSIVDGSETHQIAEKIYGFDYSKLL